MLRQKQRPRQCGVGQQADELFTTVACDQVTWPPQAVPQCGGHAAQAVVTCLVAVTVVVALEKIDIEQHHAQRAVVASGAAPLGRQPLVKVAPVVNPCEAIDVDPLAQQIGLGLQRQVRAHAGAHDLRVDGLGNEVHRTQLQSQRLCRFVVVGGDEDDRDVAGCGIGLQPTAHLVAIHAGHHHVQQHQVGLLGKAHRQRLLATGGHQHLMVGGKGLVQRLDVDRLVIHHQQARGPLGRRQQC